MSDVFTTIMHHPSRKELLDGWKDSIDYDFIATDRKEKGVWHTAKMCWEQGLASGADWVHVIQDDAKPCKDISPIVEALTEAVSDRCICLFCIGSKKRVKAYHRDIRWLKFRYSTWGLSMLLPATWVRDFWIFLRSMFPRSILMTTQG